MAFDSYGNNFSIEDRALMFARFMTENNETVRGVAKHFGFSKSTVHKDLTTKLKRKNGAVYSEVAKLLEKNKQARHLRGGRATKEKYAKIRNTEKDDDIKRCCG